MLLVLMLRRIHIVAGSLWVGFAVFVSFMLGPALEDAGSGAAGSMPALRAPGARAGKFGAVLLLLSATGMALARYL